MTLELSISAAVVAAIISAAVSWLTTRITIKADAARLQREFQMDIATEAALKAMLTAAGFEKRSFEKLKHHLPGYETDNELRRALIRSGAVAFKRADGTELWGLLERNRGEVFK